MNGKSRLSRIVWRAAYVLLIGLGVFAIYTFVVGVTGGEIVIFSKRVDGSIRFEQSPFWFSATAIAWLLGGLYLIRLGIDGWRES